MYYSQHRDVIQAERVKGKERERKKIRCSSDLVQRFTTVSSCQNQQALGKPRSTQRHSPRPFFNPRNNYQSIFKTRVQRGGTEDPLCSRCGDGGSSLHYRQTIRSVIVAALLVMVGSWSKGMVLVLWWCGCGEDRETALKFRRNSHGERCVSQGLGRYD